MTVGSIYLTGLSGSGKSTISKRVFDMLKEIGANCVLLDGEGIRDLLASRGQNLGYSKKDRATVALELAKEAKRKIDDGNIVVLASICPQSKIRRQIKEIASPLMEVHIKCPVNVCAERDYKGNYKSAYAGETDLVGVTTEYEEHEVELTIESDKISVDDAARTIIAEARKFFIPNQSDCESSLNILRGEL